MKKLHFFIYIELENNEFMQCYESVELVSY